MDESGNGVDDDEHHRRQRIDAQCQIDLEIAGNDPGKERHAAVVMAKPDVDEGQPRQQHGGEQKNGGHDFGRARARGRRFRGLRLAVRGLEGGVRLARGRRAARMALIARTVCVSFAANVGRPAGIARTRAGERDERRDDGAQKRQENDGVVHAALSPSSG